MVKLPFDFDPLINFKTSESWNDLKFIYEYFYLNLFVSSVFRFCLRLALVFEYTLVKEKFLGVEAY